MSTVYIAHPRSASRSKTDLFVAKGRARNPSFLSQRPLWCRIDRSGSSAQGHDDGIAHGVMWTVLTAQIGRKIHGADRV